VKLEIDIARCRGIYAIGRFCSKRKECKRHVELLQFDPNAEESWLIQDCQDFELMIPEQSVIGEKL
jgi:hypothetical protein